MEYYQFCKKQFEYELRNMGLGWMEDITEAWLEEGNESWERIYRISTKNKSVDIIIFSSLDMRTNHVRDNGADAVRTIIRWKTKHGFIYKRIGKNYRVRNLFRNLQGTIKEAQSQVFNLNFKEFTPSMG
ncbi:MAG: hypothetical protein K0R18_364 [Bacillales bacterium]|jgi:hypothetical protein|nr:hypothetical protein [Bacillales bacterium]